AGGVEFLLGEHDIPAFFELIALDDVVPGHFLAVGLGDPLVADGGVVTLSELLEAGAAVLGGRVHRHRDGHEPEADGTLPDRTRHAAIVWEFAFFGPGITKRRRAGSRSQPRGGPGSG